MMRPAVVQPTQPTTTNNPPPPPSTSQPTEKEDPATDKILLSAPYLTSLIQEKTVQGNIVCHGFYARGTDFILDIYIMDADNPANKVQPVEQIIRGHEHRKKNLYLHKYLDQRRHFTPYVVVSDGSLGEKG